MNVMNFRLAQESDLSQMSFIWYERIAFLQQSDSYFTPLPDATQVWEQQVSVWLSENNVACYIAEYNSRIVGYIIVAIVAGPVGLHPKTMGKIIEMGLELHEVHRGLAKGLVTCASAWLAERDIRLLTVELPARYPVEEAFWRSIGANLRFNEFWIVI